MIDEDNVMQLFAEFVPEQIEAIQQCEAEWGDTYQWLFWGSNMVKRLAKIYCADTPSETLIEQANRILEFVERCLLEGDKTVLALMRVGFLEKLEPTVPCYQEIKAQLRPVSLENLQLVDDFWAGKLKRKE